jgi:hypothetical protein
MFRYLREELESGFDAQILNLVREEKSWVPVLSNFKNRLTTDRNFRGIRIIWARNREGKGLSYRPARLHSSVVEPEPEP